MEEKLMLFGLTRKEATIYICLHENGAMNGYETAKLTGISRSNVYGALGGLVEKGAAYLMEGSSNKYMAVPVEEMCDNYLRKLTEAKQHIEKNLTVGRDDSEGYITIEGHKHIADKIYAMLSKVKYRVYISASDELVSQYLSILISLAKQGKKVVLLTDKAMECTEPMQWYYSGKKEGQIHIIVDSAYVLTGVYSGKETDTCLYSGQRNFVNVLKEAVSNEIRLSELGYGKENDK